MQVEWRKFNKPIDQLGNLSIGRLHRNSSWALPSKEKWRRPTESCSGQLRRPTFAFFCDKVAYSIWSLMKKELNPRRPSQNYVCSSNTPNEREKFTKRFFFAQRERPVTVAEERVSYPGYCQSQFDMKNFLRFCFYTVSVSEAANERITCYR